MKVCESDNSPSLTDTLISISPKKFWDGINSNTLFALTVTLPDLFDRAELISAEKDKSSPSTSVANNSNSNVLSSSLIWLEIETNSGASLAGVTVIDVCFVVVNKPSLTVTKIVLLPDWSAFGIIVNVLISSELPSAGSTVIDSNKAELLFKYPTVKLSFGSKSIGLTVNVILSWSSTASGNGSGLILSINGKSIVFSKLIEIFCSDDESLPSDAITPKVTSPLALVFGYTVNVLPEIS